MGKPTSHENYEQVINKSWASRDQKSASFLTHLVVGGGGVPPSPLPDPYNSFEIDWEFQGSGVATALTQLHVKVTFGSSLIKIEQLWHSSFKWMVFYNSCPSGRFLKSPIFVIVSWYKCSSTILALHQSTCHIQLMELLISSVCS